jgi:ABC-type lipoprotein export system ATPase subunit
MGMTQDKKIFIKVRDIEQQFSTGDELVTVLKKVSCDIAENSFTIIYGASGSGKSTLLNILSGLQRPSKGTITFEDQNIYQLSADDVAHFRANKIGIVYQTNYWVKSLNVIENVSMPLYFLGYGRAQAAKLAMLALERVNMQEYAKKYPILLSGGEQQRIGLARALVNDPLFIIADEPTGSLDSKNGDQVMSVLRQAQSEFKRTVILVTHNMEYLPLADNLLHIQDGVLTAMQGDSIKSTTDELINATRKRIHELAEKKHV